jgi:hypothetical protein
MKISYFLFLLFFIANTSYGQEEKITIQLQKEKNAIYKGQNEEVKDWYLCIDSDSICYLANLTIPEEEIENWFEIRKNSNNIFKGKIEGFQYATVNLTKDNDQETSMAFYINYEGKMRVVLTSISDGLVYIFSRF